MKVLITGGAGFIGSNLARHINAQYPGWDVHIIDDLSTGYRENLAGIDAEFFEGSILDLEFLAAAVAGVDSVVHLAAIPSVPRSVAAPRPTHDANSTGTLNVLEAARTEGIEQVIVASSSSVYGSNPALPKSEFDWTRPMSPYAVSKQATEGYPLAYNFSYGMKNLAFRFFNVYGPGQAAGHSYAAVIPQFLDAALSGETLVVHGDGLQSRDFTFVGTVCDIIATAIAEGIHSNDPVNLAFNTNTTLMDLISRIEEELGHPVETKHQATRVGDVRASQSDGIRVRALFPKVVPVTLRSGLAKTVVWFQESRAGSTEKA
ncbi:NAD-dependent epimerase/dehydratase family protein [Cryobacterium levicorallinum]|uniref:NAD-dependent epimerase/dehydratase family protein n=1 Tax=Cryobacterium levicorallinum TaxID=995038 RepID=A0A1I3E0J8_9MICO|nr:NAD-dependent epimerase/dehydratase family protein [Cryobacterium levicorallinum]TFB81515.1 NAD-dependent epimerase/dehydratase family protein [Cryobacterium levicorallinum]GEP28557.1 dTDP-glucose 4,6-dehydratase [Cryobacterium levicorallinum]SFH92514.1 UDP-glucose 4-epimerase [Cryobacterium levicorallinum]